MPSRRRRRYLLGAAAGLALLTAGGTVAWGGQGEASDWQTLTMRPEGSGTDCGLTVENLRRYPVAFEATVTMTSVENNEANLSVNYWYKGNKTRAVHLRASRPFPASLGVKLERNRRYLIPAEGGFVPGCLVKEATPELRSLYQQASVNR